MTDIIKELDSLPDSVEAIQKAPMIKPLLEFREAVKSLLRDESAEREYLESKDRRLKELLETGVYENSFIANRYADVLEVYKRLFLIFTKYTEVADETVKKMKKIMEVYYVPRSEIGVVEQFEKVEKSPKTDFQKLTEEVEGFFEPVEPEKTPRYEDPVPEPPQTRWRKHVSEVRKKYPTLLMKEILKIASQTYK